VKFGGTLIYVPDVDAALTFYERAFGALRRFADPGGMYGEIDGEGAVLGFVRYDLAESNLPNGFRKNDPAEKPAGIEVAFEANDVDAAYKTALAGGATAESPPTDKPWGQRIAYVRDLNGVLVELGSPMQTA